MRWLALFLLAGCSGHPDPVTISPTLACKDEVVCHVISWRLGMRDGPSIAGRHITCRCKGDSNAAQEGNV
jgi:hypothetical protein